MAEPDLLSDLADGVRWFGSEPWGPICLASQWTSTPIGVPCFWCGEPIAAVDDGCLVPFLSEVAPTRKPYHQECFLRTVVGSLAHLERRCTCYRGSKEHDDFDGTKREEAQAVARVVSGVSRGRR